MLSSFCRLGPDPPIQQQKEKLLQGAKEKKGRAWRREGLQKAAELRKVSRPNLFLTGAFPFLHFKCWFN